MLLLTTGHKIDWETSNVTAPGSLTLSAPLGHGHLMQSINAHTGSFLELCKPGGLESGWRCIFVEPCELCAAMFLPWQCVLGFVCLPQ